MYYIGLDVHKKSISFCVKDAAGRVLNEGKIGSTRQELDAWVETLPQPRMIAMETIMSISGHVSREMLTHYSHFRQEAKRKAVAALDNVTITSQLGNWKTNAEEWKRLELKQNK